jgi:hypothetical protein
MPYPNWLRSHLPAIVSALCLTAFSCLMAISFSPEFLNADVLLNTIKPATRLDLPIDIPLHGELKLNVSVDPKTEIKGGSLQFSMVQEAGFWGHDIGVVLVTIPWN